MQSGNATLGPLSDEIILEIFSYFKIDQILLLALVSRNIKRIALDNRLLFTLAKSSDAEKYDETIDYKSRLQAASWMLYFLKEAAESLAKRLQAADPDAPVNKKANDYIFYWLFFKLAKSTPPEQYKRTLIDALIGAWLYQRLGTSQTPFSSVPSLYTIDIDNFLNKCFLDKGRKGLQQQLYYLTCFKDYLEKMPDELMAGVNWSRDELTKKLRDVWCKKYFAYARTAIIPIIHIPRPEPVAEPDTNNEYGFKKGFLLRRN